MEYKIEVFFFLRSVGKNICRNDKGYGGFLENVGGRLGFVFRKGWVLKFSECDYVCLG